MTDSIFELRSLRKECGSSFTLEINDFHVHQGETLALLGPTGAGKTTLLRLLAGLESPSQGEIRFDSQPFLCGMLPMPTRRRIVMVHQRPALVTGSVRDNIEYGLKLRRVLQHSHSLLKETMQRFRLEKLADQSAQTLSGGQVQLVALARSTVITPDVLLLDEPTANLDPAHVALVEESLLSIQSARPMTIVWATHNLFQARRIAQRVALLWDGKLIEVSATERFFESPTSPRTADFLQGKMVY